MAEKKLSYPFYQVYIDHVDGETYYEIGTADKKEAREFLARHDHEGSSLSMKLTRDRRMFSEYFNEEVYKQLEG